MTRTPRFHADHILILQGASWVVLFVLLGRIVIAIKEMAIASQFGVSGVVDAYQVGLTAASWLPSTLATALSVVLVPIFVRARAVSAENEVLFVREVQGVFFVFGLFLTLVTLLVGVFYVNQIADTLSSETLILAIEFTRWLSPTALLMLMIGVLTARLQSRGNQLNTLFECIPALVILVCILLPLFSVGSDALLWGTLIGFALNAIFLMVVGSKDGIGWRASCRISSPHWPEVYRAVGVMTIGSFVMSFIVPLDQYMAAQLGEGSIATLGYANRLLALGLGAGTLVITRGVMPVLANAIAEGKNDHARLLAIKWALVLLVLGIIVVVVAWILAPLVVSLLFERGAFTATDTKAVATCLRWGLLQIPIYISALVLVQLLATLGLYRFIALVAVGNFFTKAIMNFVLVPHWGLEGIMMASSAMYLFAFIAFWLRVKYITSSAPDPQAPDVLLPLKIVKEKMKIVIFVHSLHGGGAERVTSHLANAWAKMGRDVTIITMTDIEGDVYTLHPSVHRIGLNMATESHGHMAALIANVSRLKKLRATLKQLDVDVVVAMTSMASVLAVLASLGSKSRTVIAERCYPPLIPFGRLWSLSRRLVYPWADCVVAQTQETKRWLTQNVGCRRIAVIPNPVVLPLLAQGAGLHPDAVLKSDRKVLLAAGRLCEVKGFELLVEAFSRIAHTCPQWDLVILGEGPDRHALEQQITRANLNKRVYLPGPASNIADWYTRADLFVLSSRAEGFPNVLIEAMAHGCATVSYDCHAGPRDIITHGVNGLLVKPVEDIGALASALFALMSDENTRHQMAQKAVVVQEKFSTREILLLWESVIKPE